MSPSSIRDSIRRRGSLARVLGALACVALVSCYSGGEREKEAPPGYPGGLCVDGVMPTCEDQNWVCVDGAFCMDVDDPCNGVFCGGYGKCLINDQQLPYCLCDDGFNNEQYYLICEPDSGGVDMEM